MKLLDKKFTIFLLVLFFILPNFAEAGITYTRKTVDLNTLSFEIEFDDFGVDSGLGIGFSSWGLNMYHIDGVDVYQTESIPVSTEKYSFIVARENFDLRRVSFYGCDTSNDCSYEGVIIQNEIPQAESVSANIGGGVGSSVGGFQSPENSFKEEVLNIPLEKKPFATSSEMFKPEIKIIDKDFLKNTQKQEFFPKAVISIYPVEKKEENISQNKKNEDISLGAEGLTLNEDVENDNSVGAFSYIKNFLYKIIKLIF